MRDDPRYAPINDGRTYPPLTRVEAGQYAQRILHSHLGSPKECAVRNDGMGGWRDAVRNELFRIYRRYTDQHPSGKGRTCWAAVKPTTGHDKGWGRLIHDVSHMLHEYRHPNHRAHEHGHERIEIDVLRYVETSGWLAPRTPEPKSTPAQRRSLKLNSLAERIARWESKKRRAENALKKLNRTVRRLEREQAAELS